MDAPAALQAIPTERAVNAAHLVACFIVGAALMLALAIVWRVVAYVFRMTRAAFWLAWNIERGWKRERNTSDEPDPVRFFLPLGWP